MPYRQTDIGSLTFYVKGGADTRALVGMIPPLVAPHGRQSAYRQLPDDGRSDLGEHDQRSHSDDACRRRLRVWRSCSPRSACTRYWRTASRSGCARSASGSRWAPETRTSAGSCCRRSDASASLAASSAQRLALAIGRAGRAMLFGVAGLRHRRLSVARCCSSWPSSSWRPSCQPVERSGSSRSRCCRAD